MSDCIFCRIVAKEVPTKMIYEDDQVVVFNDIHPKAKTHILVTAKAHIPSLNELTEQHTALVGHMIQVLPKVAKILGISSFRTMINTGAESGQEIPHLHFHLLSGSLPKFGL